MSLRARILALVFASSLLPLLVVFWTLLESREAAIDQARERVGTRASQLAGELDDKVSGTAQLLFGLSRVAQVGGTDKAACSDFLAAVLDEHPQYTGLLTIQPDGNMFCDSLRTGRSLNVSDRAYFRRALDAPGVVVEPVIGRLTGKGVLQIAYPARSADRTLRYILLASLNMDEFGRHAAASLPYARMNLQLWNADGSLVMDYPGDGASKLVAGAAERSLVLGDARHRIAVVSGEGGRRLWASTQLSHSAGAGMRIALSVPETELGRVADEQFRQAIRGLIPLALLMVGGAVLLGEFALRRQTQRLARAIARLDQGNYDEPIGAPYPRGEFGVVMSALDRMGRSLSEQRDEIRRNTEALERQATIDPLTGLSNRALLSDRLEQALIHARRSGRSVAVMLLDLDRFKTVNDSLGHRRGDELLQCVAARLQASVREGDTVARLGGDEFVIVLNDLSDTLDLGPIARKVLDALATPVDIERHRLSVVASIGIATFPDDGDSPEQLLQHADTAMYRAKSGGGGAAVFFSPDMMQASVERLRIEAGLRRALENGELILHYQPIVDAASGRIGSAEALLRWNDPQSGAVPPVTFISVAEETGLIVPIGEWVLHTACAQTVAWQKQGLGDIPVAVNLSPRQFGAPALDRTIARAMAQTGCPASLLHLEITESTLIAQPDAAMSVLDRLSALGVGISIDDFGTGYSSLSRLKELPVDRLKIDRAFVKEIERDDSDRIIVEVIVMLAKKLGLHTVAEGVETTEQRAYLETLGCDELQGYLFSRPCAAGDFEQLVRDQRDCGQSASDTCAVR
ncbi:MAG: putative bifunctional diguanylate cyclase/phosphodiesterase [Pseudomonadota bacterium]